ncbi:QsdR family transcriptional regulator [Aquisalimonas sp.]|uniref:QsdR family transcriptional regulator n=1 Tax=unclassified Aquisalimonas TaxID=2644645 RepID=UPI0025C185B6|nr:QsdR family transcriptional regulator [Aquisalimonas sp.]
MSRKTPLALALNDDSRSSRPTPITAFRLARRWWLDGKRLNLSALAEELEIGRATLMRWVGNKELLLGEILWSLYKDVFDEAKARADANPSLLGVDYLAAIYHDVNTEVMGAEALHQFLRQDPQFALRVLTSNVSGLQRRLIDTWSALLREQADAGRIDPQLDTDSLAFFLVRIGEGAIYSDIICGREPGLDQATTAFRLLLSRPDTIGR